MTNHKSQISKAWTFGLTNNQGGFVAITTVLILSAVAIAIGITVSRLAIGEGQASLALTNGEHMLSFAEGCMEDALLKARASATYAGGTIGRPADEGTCTVTVSKAGNVWTITTTQNGTTNYTKSVQVVVTRNPTGLVLTSWQEI